MKKIILLFMIVFSLVGLFSVNAVTCGFIGPTPASGSNITRILNGTFANPGTTLDTISMAYYIQGGGNTQNTSLTLFFNVSNNTGAMPSSSINITLTDSQVVQDGNDYTLSCTCTNSTAVTNCNSTRTSMQWNRNVPTAPTAITFTNPLLDTNTITATIDRLNANRCWIRFGGPSVERNAMTLSGTTCTFTVGRNSPPNADYQAFVSADDRLDTDVLSGINYITINAVQSDGNIAGTITMTDGGMGGSQSPINSLFGKISNNNNGVAGVIILLLAAAYLFRKK